MKIIAKNLLAFALYFAICCIGNRVNSPLLGGCVLLHVSILIIQAFLSTHPKWISYVLAIVTVCGSLAVSLVGALLVFGIKK